MKNCFFILSVLFLAAAGCTGGQQPAGKPLVFVSIPPQAYLVEQIGAEHIEVRVLVPPGQSPHSYEPTPKQMAELSHAQAYFAIGVPFEKQLLAKINKSYDNVRIFDISLGIDKPEEEEHDGHDEHHHGEIDPHIWLNPHNAVTICDNILKALWKLDPERGKQFESNLFDFHRKLVETTGKVNDSLQSFRGRRFYVFHPAFGHLARAYGLEQVSVEVEGKEPSARDLARLIKTAKNDGINVIFVQPQFPKASAEAVARETGARIEVMDPLAKDYLKNLEEMAEKIAEAISGREK